MEKPAKHKLPNFDEKSSENEHCRMDVGEFVLVCPSYSPLGHRKEIPELPIMENLNKFLLNCSTVNQLALIKCQSITLIK